MALSIELNLSNKRASFKDGIIYWKRTKQKSVSITGLTSFKQMKKKITKNDPDNYGFCNHVKRFLTSLLWINSTCFPWNLCDVNKCSNHFGTLTPFVEITVTLGVRLPSFDVHCVYLSSFQFLIRVNFHPQYTSGLPEAFSKPQ